MCDPILETLTRIQPHNSQPSHENATPSSGTSPLAYYSRLSLNGHLYKTGTSLKRTPTVGPCHSLLPLFDSL